MNSWLIMLNSHMNLIPCCQPEAAFKQQYCFDSKEIFKMFRASSAQRVAARRMPRLSGRASAKAQMIA